MSERIEGPEMTPGQANIIRLLSGYGVLGYELTLLEIEKILYFLQESGEPLRLRFEKGPHGPYADNLRHVLHDFEGHFLEDIGDGRNSPRTPIRLFDEAVSEAERVSEESSTPEQRERGRRVFGVIEGFESPYGMELLASVHWAVDRDRVPSDPESLIQAVHQWSDRKRRIMKPEHIRVAWNRLRDLGWLGRDTASDDDRT
jgi:hypothetical protein